MLIQDQIRQLATMFDEKARQSRLAAAEARHQKSLMPESVARRHDEDARQEEAAAYWSAHADDARLGKLRVASVHPGSADAGAIPAYRAVLSQAIAYGCAHFVHPPDEPGINLRSKGPGEPPADGGDGRDESPSPGRVTMAPPPKSYRY